MTKQFLTVLFSLLSSIVWGNNGFQKGEIITSENSKINCLIKIPDAQKNPVSVIYKLNENNEQKELNIEDINGFTIYNSIYSYVKKEVNVELTSYDLNNLSKKNEFTPELKTLLLRTVVQGNVNLYVYTNSSTKVEVFFYEFPARPITQLHRKYFTEERDAYSIANNYQNQLYRNVNCKQKNTAFFERIEYTEAALTHVIKEFNKCKGYDYKIFNNKLQKQPFTFSIGLGANFQNIKYSDNAFGSISVKKKVVLQYGVELVYNFQNTSKWALTFSPSFKDYNTTLNYTNPYDNGKYDYKLSTLTVPVGIRYYVDLGQGDEIYLTTSAGFVGVLNDAIVKRNGENRGYQKSSFTKNTQINFAIGTKIAKKVKLELSVPVINPQFIKSPVIKFNSLPSLMVFYQIK